MRWLFESRRIAYEARADAPGSYPEQARAGVDPEPPLLIAPDGAYGGLIGCLRYFEDISRPGERPFGEDEETRARAWALIETLCRELLPSAVGDGPTAGEDASEPSRAGVERAFAAAAAELDGRPFIGGDSPGALDIVFAALAAPLILPGGRGPNSASPAAAAAPSRELSETLRATPGGALALRILATRPDPQPTMVAPTERRGLLERIATPQLVRFGARLAARFGPRSLRFNGATLVFRWADVSDMLRRDLDCLIAPVNAARIEAVSGPFILGMDRSEPLFAQRRVVYGALSEVAPGPVAKVLKSEPDRLLDLATRRGERIDVVNGYARPVAARTAAALFGIAGPTEADQMRVARAVFHETFLNLGGDKAVAAAGVAAGHELLGWIEAEAARRRAAGAFGEDLLGRLLVRERAGEIAPTEAGQILAGLFVGAIDTTATAVANITAEMLLDPALARSIERDAGDRELVWGWCLEALRRRPHNPILLRQAAEGATVCGAPVPAGERVIAVTLAAMQDGRVFDAPATMVPTRPRELYMHFGYGMHLCSGRDLNAVQIPALVSALARRRPGGRAHVVNRGPFPDRLVVTLEDTP